MESHEGMEMHYLLDALKSWAKSGISAVGEREIEEQFMQSIYETVGGEDFFQTEIYQTLGPQFIEGYIEDMDDIDDQEKMEEAWDEQRSGYGPEEGAEDFIFTHDLEKQFEEFVSESEYGTLNWFLDMYHVSDAVELFSHLIDNEEFYRKLFFNSYVQNFPGLDETVEETQRVKAEVDAAAESTDISEKIITFQLGLNTAHQFGTMADHLLETGTGGGQSILDELSSGSKVDLWNKELEQIIGFKSPEDKAEWFTPESHQIEYAIDCLAYALEFL
jgi:hypothetical protein